MVTFRPNYHVNIYKMKEMLIKNGSLRILAEFGLAVTEFDCLVLSPARVFGCQTWALALAIIWQYEQTSVVVGCPQVVQGCRR